MLHAKKVWLIDNMVCHEGGLKKKKKTTYVKLQRSEITPSSLPDFRVPQVKNSSYLTIDVLLQTNGTVRGGAAAQRIRGSAAALALSLAFGLELSCLHLFQSLDGHSVHRALWRGGCGTVSEGVAAHLRPTSDFCTTFRSKVDIKAEMSDFKRNSIKVSTHYCWQVCVLGGWHHDLTLLPLTQCIILQYFTDAWASFWF